MHWLVVFGLIACEKDVGSTIDSNGIHDTDGSASTDTSDTMVQAEDTAVPSTTGDVQLHEFLASNTVGKLDEDGDTSDWIELLNRGDTSVSLEGWSLTDSLTEPSRWTFPEVVLEPGEFLVVFASGKDRAIAGSELHTDFKLNAEGEYLGLFDAQTPARVATELAPAFGPQTSDVSSGRHDSEGFWLLSTPTPGADNETSETAGAEVATLAFSHGGGLFEAAFTVGLQVQGDATLHCRDDELRPGPSDPLCGDSVEVSGATRRRVALVSDGETVAEVTRTWVLLDPGLADFDSNLPVAVIESFGDREFDESSEFSPCWVSIVEPGSEGRTSLTARPSFTGRAGLHLRGNSSRGYEKHQYRMELWDESDDDDAASLLGLPGEADWILHAPYSDKTLARNHLMYRWSRSVGRYAVRSEFLEVFVDWDGDGVDTEDYAGVYVLMEVIEQGEDRVDVASLDSSDTTEPEVTGGYVLKKDWVDWGNRSSYFETDHYEDALIYVDPDGVDLGPEQKLWLQDWVNTFEGALSGSNFTDTQAGYAAYIDPLSFIDHHLLVELGRNVDGYVLSTYLHKDREGRLNMGPIWDYNGALGNADYFRAWETAGWHFENPEFPADNPNAYHWYTRLFQDPAFVVAYRARWMELRAGPLATEVLMADISETAALLDEGAGRNFERWNILGEYVWPNAEGWQTRRSYEAEVDYLSTWLTDRLEWMDSQLSD